MGILQVLSAVLLIIAGIFLIITVLMQDSKKGMSGALTGGSADNYYHKNSERSKEAKLKKMTRFAAFLILLITFLANLADANASKDGDWLGGCFGSGEETVPNYSDSSGTTDPAYNSSSDSSSGSGSDSTSSPASGTTSDTTASS